MRQAGSIESYKYFTRLEYKKDSTNRISKLKIITKQKIEERDISGIEILINGGHRIYIKSLKERGVTIEDNTIILDDSPFAAITNIAYTTSADRLNIYVALESWKELVITRCEITIDRCMDQINTREADSFYDEEGNKLYCRLSMRKYEQLKNLKVYLPDAKIKMYDEKNNLLDVNENHFENFGDHLSLKHDFIDYVDNNVVFINVFPAEKINEEKDYVEYDFCSKLKMPSRFID